MSKIMGLQVVNVKEEIVEYLIVTLELWEKIKSLNTEKIYVPKFINGQLVEQELKCEIIVLQEEELIECGVIESDKEFFYHSIEADLFLNNVKDLNLDNEIRKAEYILGLRMLY